MRYAIEAAWRYGRLQALHENFGYTVLPERGKPTNRAFLAQLTEDLKRQLQPKRWKACKIAICEFKLL